MNLDKDHIVQMGAEEQGPALTLVEGGPEDGAAVPIDSRMPVGAKTLLGGAVYVLSPQRKLIFSEEETKKLPSRRS